jgi:hypothetical protein
MIIKFGKKKETEKIYLNDFRIDIKGPEDLAVRFFPSFLSASP